MSQIIKYDVGVSWNDDTQVMIDDVLKNCIVNNITPVSINVTKHGVFAMGFQKPHTTPVSNIINVRDIHPMKNQNGIYSI